MRKIVFFILSMLASNMIHSQFHWIELNDIYSFDSLSAWVVGEGGTIIKLENEGLTWEDYSYNTNVSLNSVHFINDSTGFIVGNAGMLLRSDDGGITWSEVDLGASHDFKEISFTDGQYGWISHTYYGGGTGFFRTENGGIDWNYVNTTIKLPWFLDSLNGWGHVSYIPTIIYRTYNGGLNWDSISSFPTNPHPLFYFINTNVGSMTYFWIGGTNCYNTTNGGRDWTENNLIYYGGDLIYELYYMDSLNGWACGDLKIAYSSDMFVDKISMFGASDEVFRAISINGYSNGWAISYNWWQKLSRVWKLDGTNYWIPIESLLTQEKMIVQQLRIFPNPFTTSTTIEYELKEISNIQFTIYNVIGEVVYNAEDLIMSQGIHTVTWSPGHLPEGMYYGVLRSDEGVAVVKIIKQ